MRATPARKILKLILIINVVAATVLSIIAIRNLKSIYKTLAILVLREQQSKIDSVNDSD